MSDVYPESQSRGFLWIVLIGSVGGVILTVANAITFDRTRTDNTTISRTITRNTANVLFWLNVILAVVFAIIFIWAIYRLLIHPKTRSEVRQASQPVYRPPPVRRTTQQPSRVTTVHRTSPGKTLTTTSGSLAANEVTPDTAQALKAQVAAYQ